MSDSAYDLDELSRRMDGAVSSLRNELSGLRTGRASASLLDPIMANAYGSMMPINQLGTVSVPEPRMISVSIWDKGLVTAVDKAIRDSNLGLNPVVDGTTLRLPIPELNEERRKELVKVAHTYAEQSRIAVRHVRRDGMDAAKKAEKAGDISEDDHRSISDDIQNLTDSHIEAINKLLSEKEAEIMTV